MGLMAHNKVLHPHFRGAWVSKALYVKEHMERIASLINIYISLVVAIFSVTSIAHANNELDLFIEGCHLDDPIPTPEKWNALFITNSNEDTFAKSLKVDLVQSKKVAGVDDLYDHCVHLNPKGVDEKNSKPTILIKGPRLREGVIDSATVTKNSFREHENHTFVGGVVIPETDESIEIKLGSNKYILRQVTNLDDNFVGNNHILTLSHNGISQVIFDKRGNYEGATGFYIIWAGDIDNDDKLDLILNLPESYASPYHLRMLLSSYATNGRLVKEVVQRGFSSP